MNHGFPPIQAPGARALVLGTLPSVTSLEKRQYYGHPQNAFWRVMGVLFDAGLDLPYEERARVLAGCGVAVWDVLAAAEREGSGDAEIKLESALPNDIEWFLAKQPRVRTIFLNGGTAESLFRRFVIPRLSPEVVLPPLVRLPSTSPANARLGFEGKLEAWRVVAETVRDEQ